MTKSVLINYCMRSLSPLIENIICVDEHIGGGYSAYAIQCGLYGQIKRKEVRSVGCSVSPKDK